MKFMKNMKCESIITEMKHYYHEENEDHEDRRLFRK